MTFILDADRPDVAPRSGPAPLTTKPSADNPFPHQQLTQLAPPELQEKLYHRAITLPGVQVGDSCISVPGARAFVLTPDMANGPQEAFQCSTEFAHLHPSGDGSMHLTLPEPLRTAVIEAGWATPHPISGTPLAYGPRDEAELEQVWQILLASYRFAVGAKRESTEDRTRP